MSLSGLADPSVVHETLRALALERASSDYELGRWLVAAYRLRVWGLAGYGSFGEYVERLFGFSRRMAHERLRVGLALESLPRMAAALKSGELAWSVVRELSRVALERNEEEWIAQAWGKTARGVEEMVSGKEPGDSPMGKPDSPPPVRVSFTVSAAARALLGEARNKLCAEMGERVSDEVLIESMARALLGGESRDDGVSSYQIALTTCHRCGVTTQSAGGEDVVADEVTVETARCDAQELGRVDVPTPGRATQTVPPRVRRAVLRRHHRRCAVPGCRQSTFVDVHHLDRQADGGDHHADNLIALCGAHHRATHVGTLVIRGSYSTGLDFEHADGSSYGEPAVEPAKAGVLATVLELLVGMGWKQREAQSMVDRVRAHVGVGASVEDALRAALQAAPVAGASVVREEVAVYQRLAA